MTCEPRVQYGGMPDMLILYCPMHRARTVLGWSVTMTEFEDAIAVHHAEVAVEWVDPLLPTTSDGSLAIPPHGVFKRDAIGETIEPLNLTYQGIEDDKHVWLATFTEWNTGDLLLSRMLPGRTEVRVADHRAQRDPDRLERPS